MAGVCLLGQKPQEPGEFEKPVLELDKVQLIEVEDLSENLANALLDFSVAVRDRRLNRIGEFFSPQVQQTSFPDFSSLPAEKVRWFESVSIDLPESAALRDRQDVMQDWERFLAGFSELEDARFKVKDASFSGPSERRVADGKIKFFLVGRDNDRKRIWIKGTGLVRAASRGEQEWSISKLTFDHVARLRASIDLFSEIAEPAGLSVQLPAYGSPGNNDFIYHGAAAGDLNRDGLIDLVVTGVSDTYVYLNQGDGTFRQSAREMFLPPNRRATAPLLVDFDNDGDLDLFLSVVGEQMLFENRLKPDGKTVFEDISLLAGVSRPAVGFSAAAGDVNRDGWPDIYVASYNRYGEVMPDSWHQASNGTPNLLFVNQQDGTFRESSREWGVADSRWSYAAQFVDVNGDGKQDLYVANDFGENALYINLENRFEDRASAAGVVDPGNGMGVSFGDYDNDGVLDLFVTNMSSTAGNRILNRLFPDSGPGNNVLRKLAAGNNLYRGRRDGTFEDVTERLGPFSAGWAWGGVFFDFDNDGWQDLYSTSGFVSGKSMKDT